MDILELIKRRRSIPKFSPQPVPRATIQRMLETATWAPNHHLTEPWGFIVLEGASRDRFAAIRRDSASRCFPTRPHRKRRRLRIRSIGMRPARRS